VNYPRHPASDAERYDIPDLADTARQEAEDARVEPQERAPLDYSDCDIPDVAGDVEHERGRAER
jgi:hypothetical protein